jgi:hypothetical protein
MKFRVVIEKNWGIRDRHYRQVNPFRVRDLFGSELQMRVERRVWDEMEAENEEALRAFFAEAQAERHESVDGFRIVSIEPLAEGAAA